MDTLDIQVMPFPLFPSTLEVSYVLRGETGNLSGRLELPESVVADWGTDDTVVLNYVVGQLGVTLIPEPPAEEPTEE